MARTGWSESDQAVRTVHSCNSWWLALLWSNSVIKLVSVLFGKCTTLVVTKCWPMVIRQPCGDQWKAEKLGAFWRWPITRCFIKSDSTASLIIEHTVNFALSGNSHGPCNIKILCTMEPKWQLKGNLSPSGFSILYKAIFTKPPWSKE